jgi:1,2-diacylglycerol 3-beta-galactosyltransferase
MILQSSDCPHILFLFSDTGGGHRSAAEAIIEAIHLEYGERISTDMVDIFKQYAPIPLNRMPELYPHFVRVPQAWGLGYRLSDGHHRARFISASAWPYIRNRIRTLVNHHPSNLIVSVHPLANAPMLRAMGKQRPPFIIMVTDLVTTHALWYHRAADLCLVPTESAYQRALACGLKPTQIKVVGLPVADRFCQHEGEPLEKRACLGWPVDRPIILLVGGGEGMGPLEKTALSIAAARLPATLVIVTGRNKDLKQRLEARKWAIPTLIYGFVREMPDFMRAADILVTKAGPGTISEAFIAGLPMVLYSRLPGQEDGNVTYVTTHGAGIWVPRPEQIVPALQDWLDNPILRHKASEAARRLARPQAARSVAHILAAQLGIKSPQN